MNLMDSSHLTVARDYINIVNSFPYSSTLVAANASFSASDMSGLSTASANQLLEASMQSVVSTTVAFVSISKIRWKNDEK